MTPILLTELDKYIFYWCSWRMCTKKQTGKLYLLATLQCHVSKTSIDLEVTGQCVLTDTDQMVPPDLLYKLYTIILPHSDYILSHNEY